jgi:diacylglycerol kinase (ATP)
MRISVVVNPRAGAGNAGRHLPGLRRQLDELGLVYEILETEQRGHATALAADAIARGCSLLAVVGGDGTLNEVSQAYIDAAGGPRSGPPIALIPCGTGGDFPKSCNFTGHGLAAAVARIENGRRVPLDLGVLTVHDSGGRPLHRAFLNVVSVGISGEVDERVERGPKWLGGKAAFLLGTVSAALVYRNVPLEIEVDGAVWQRGPVVITAIANGQFLGGGMQIAPAANFSDGLLDVVSVGDLGRFEFLRLFPHVYKGTHLGLDAVRTLQGRTVTIRAIAEGKPVMVDVDGETPGYLPLSARIFPGALQLVTD